MEAELMVVTLKLVSGVFGLSSLGLIVAGVFTGRYQYIDIGLWMLIPGLITSAGWML